MARCRLEMISKLHAMLLSVFPLANFHLGVTLIHNFIKLWVVASIPGFLLCMWCTAKKYCLANNVLGVSSCIQWIQIRSLGSLKTGAILLARFLFPTAGAALASSMLSSGGTVIPGVCVALACTAVPRGSKNCVFDHALLRYTVTVSLTVIVIIMNWFHAAQPDLQFVASSVIGFVVNLCMWNGEVKQLMIEVWDWNMYGTKLKKFHGLVRCAAIKDLDRGKHDGTTLPEDRRDGPKDGSSIGSVDVDGHEDHVAASEDSDDDNLSFGPRAVQLLSIRANFRINCIVACDWNEGWCIYKAREGEVQEEGMVDLELIGPQKILQARACLALVVYIAGGEGSCTGPIFRVRWGVDDDVEIEEYTQNISLGPGRKMEVTYFLMSDSIEACVEVRLNLKDSVREAAPYMVASRLVPLTMGAKASISSVVNEGGACPFLVAPHPFFH